MIGKIGDLLWAAWDGWVDLLEAVFEIHPLVGWFAQFGAAVLFGMVWKGVLS